MTDGARETEKVKDGTSKRDKERYIEKERENEGENKPEQEMEWNSISCSMAIISDLLYALSDI